MPRGNGVEVGATRVSANGYHYTKVEDGRWRFTHHLAMEKILGRPLAEDERVHFVTSDKLDFSEKNLKLVKKGTVSIRQQLARAIARRDDAIKEIAFLEGQLKGS